MYTGKVISVDKDLEKSFHEAMVQKCDLIVQKCKAKRSSYRPTMLIQKVHTVGGLQAAKDLLSVSEAQSGFTALFLEGLLDYTIETVIIQPKWRPLFSDEEIAEAKKRLVMLGFQVKNA